MIIGGVLMETVMGAVYNVGSSEGWTMLVGSSYASWTSSKSFRVGDTLLFQYNPTNHDVMQVNQRGFRSCNMTAPWKTFKTGNDSFIIRAPGHYYFICSFPSHCEAGQKLDVRVLKKNYNVTTTSHANVSSPVPPKMIASVATLATIPNCLLRCIVGLSTIYAAMWFLFVIYDVWLSETQENNGSNGQDDDVGGGGYDGDDSGDGRSSL
ncbi:blue copper protein 1b-like [Bidens hawaiensis]|uniref:blue copper protein 1b-like n=1 Tax=Bidens hawaiensis TaxID=980011 RepID=UPI00404A9F93